MNDSRDGGQTGQTCAKRRRVLIVEDEMLPALLLEDAVAAAGHEVSRAARLSSAFELAEAGSFDAAVLDVNLNGEKVFPLATRLRATGVPMMFTTGYGRAALPDEFRTCPVLQKPYRIGDFNAALVGLLAGT